jgi:hypothetical protein
VEVVEVKHKTGKPKLVPGNSLRRYFLSSRNAESASPSWKPKTAASNSGGASRAATCVASLSQRLQYNPAIKLVSLGGVAIQQPRSNPVVKLVCPGGLPRVIVPPKDVEEVS